MGLFSETAEEYAMKTYSDGYTEGYKEGVRETKINRVELNHHLMSRLLSRCNNSEDDVKNFVNSVLTTYLDTSDGIEWLKKHKDANNIK